MDYFGNAEMILWPPLAGDYSFDEIPDYDGSLDLTIESRPEYNADSSFQQQEKYPATREEMINWQEQIRMIHLRSHLNKLLETVTQAQYLVDKTSEELKKCHCQIEQHEDERDRLYKELETKESEGNRPAVQRLQAAFRQVCKNLQAEKTLEGLIRERLEQAQYELALAEVERGKFILAEDDLLQRENQLASDKARMAAIRLKKEEFMTRQALVSKKNDKRKWEDAVNEAEKRHIHAVEEAEKSHERANKYLSKTLAKLKKRQQEEQDRYNEDMTRKMDMLLKLKKDIANNRENLRVIRARNLGQEREKMAKEQEEMNKLLALGGNAEEMMIIKKRKNEMEKKKQQFEAEQKLKKAKVLEKILREEENIKRKIQLQPYLFDDDDREKALRVCLRKKKLPKSLLECIEVASRPDEVGTVDDEKQKEIQEDDTVSSISYFASTEYRKIINLLSLETGEPDPATVPKKRSINRSKNKDDNEDEYMFMERAYVPDEDEIIPADEDLMEENEEEGSEEEDSSYFRALENTHLTEEKEEDLDEEDEEIQMDLAKPEFEGLWDKETKAYKSGKYADDPSAKPVNGSKMEKEILKKTLEKTREGIVKPQVAAGREFSGQPFYSKPSVIHFKDLVVGKTYKKKVILTNVSYSVNYIRFLEVSDSLKDFIKITFEPPGQMSAGMSCEMTVTFKPLINVDLSGEIHFLAQTGPFHVPLSCSTRKCDLSVDTTVVQFGTSVIGETLKRSFVLTNRGSLGTRFQFVKGTEIMPERIVPETSQDQSISEVVASAASKDASAEAAGSVESLKQNQQQAFFDHDNKSREVIHDSTVASGRVKLDSETLHWLSSTTLPIKHPSTTHQSRTVLEQSSGVSFQRDVGKASLEANDVPHVVDKVSEVDEYEMDEAEYFTESPEKSDHEPSKVSLEESMPRLVPSEEEDIGSLDGMMPGPLVAGEIGPYSSVLLEIVWQPTLTGDVKTEFTIFFADSQMEPISIFAVANAVDVPVWLERQTVDMKICMFDRLYQDTIIINSRATTSLRLQFEVCKELRNHLELLPKTGFIQAHSQFPAQLKFLPRQSLFQEAAEFFDPDTGVLEAPMTVRVAGQVTPVCFIMQAVVTTTDLEFGVCDLDFGCCTVHESVKRRFTLTNKSILPQQFGFVGLPDCLEVQPNDGFGTLLPLETLHLDVIFSPKAAKEYKMNLLCKTLINRRFSIPCQGVGVLTPLELSKQVINFSATSVNDTSTTALYVINSHTNANEYTHPVPRIGTGEIFPVGPTSFEFKVPKDAPITISPSVGTVLPGQKVLVEVRFSPVLDSDDIRLEALNIKAKLQAEKQEKERKEAEEREKREQEMLQRVSIETKSKKGYKRMDANVNNLATNNKTQQYTEFGSSNNYERATRHQNFNESATTDEDTDNLSAIIESVCKEMSFVPDDEMEFFEDTYLPFVEPNNEISNVSIEESGPGQAETRNEVSKKPSGGPNVPRQKPALNKMKRNKLPMDLRNTISNHKEEKSGKLVKDVGGVVESRPMQENVPVEHDKVIKLPVKNNAVARKTTKKNMCKMNATDSTPYLQDKNNNKDENENEGLNDSRRTSYNRLDEQAMKSQAANKGELNSRAGSPANGNDENDDDASVSKKKSSTTTMSSTFRSKSKTTVTTMATPSSTTMPGLDKMSLSLDSSIQHAAITALLRQFKGYLQSVTVPCYIAAGRAGGPGELNYSIHNTLYLEIHCPAVKPQLIVVSDEGRQTIDFGSISVGQTYSKSVTVQNICDKQLKLRATILDPMGPFQVRNACRELSPGETHTILFTFTPNKDQIFQEKLRIETLNSTLHLTLKGCGANPAVGLSVEDGVLDMKAVLVGEFVEKSFTMRNLSNLPIEFIIKQDSLSHLRHIKAQNIPPFLGTPEPHNTRNYVGPQNKSGRNVFDLVPATGTITAGETKEIVVTFAPDHESDLFSDGVRIDLFSQEESYFFQVVGQAKSQIIYLEGCDPLQPPVLSLACLPKPLEDEEGSEAHHKTVPSSIVMSPPVLITMQTLMGTDFYERCTRQIFVGCVQTMPGAPHRSGEFTLDGTQKDGTQKDGTQKDGTHKDGTPKDGTHKDGTPKDGTHKDGTPKDGTHKDGTHKDGIHKDGIHKDGIHKDGIQDLVQKSFTIQPTKGSVESGSKKAIVIAWLPPPDHDPKKVIEETMILTLKGDNITEQIPVVIRARTVQSE
ncbi:hypothetical protein BsWGS_26933 [Bradybaena similaris]